MARDPTAVVLKDMFLQNQFPYHEVRRPFILGDAAAAVEGDAVPPVFEVLDAKASSSDS